MYLSRNIQTAVLMMACITSRAAFGQTLSMAEFTKLAERCAPNIATTTLASVAITESNLNVLAVHNNTTGANATPSTPEMGATLVERLIAAEHSVDVGLMQINSRNFGWLGMTARTAFDPCVSLAAAGRVLAERYKGGTTEVEQQASLRGALSAYNTGSTTAGLRNGYVRRVEQAALRLVPALAVGNGARSEVKPRQTAPPTAADESTSWDVWATTEQDKPAEQKPPSSVQIFQGDTSHE